MKTEVEFFLLEIIVKITDMVRDISLCFYSTVHLLTWYAFIFKIGIFLTVILSVYCWASKSIYHLPKGNCKSNWFKNCKILGYNLS